MLIWTALFGVALLLAYIRFTPSDVDRWHVDVEGIHDADFQGGALRIVEADLERFDEIVRKSGASVLAGSVDEGRITYVSRTRFVGFPDYTTVQQKGTLLAIYGRLRFGKSDLSVNRKRIEGWIAQL